MIYVFREKIGRGVEAASSQIFRQDIKSKGIKGEQARRC
jgi:hypothetical protein